jgi:hypothetical protein
LDLVIYLFIMYTKFHKLVLFISSRAKHVMSSININIASALTTNQAEFHQSFQGGDMQFVSLCSIVTAIL